MLWISWDQAGSCSLIYLFFSSSLLFASGASFSWARTHVPCAIEVHLCYGTAHSSCGNGTQMSLFWVWRNTLSIPSAAATDSLSILSSHKSSCCGWVSPPLVPQCPCVGCVVLRALPISSKFSDWAWSPPKQLVFWWLCCALWKPSWKPCGRISTWVWVSPPRKSTICPKNRISPKLQWWEVIRVVSDLWAVAARSVRNASRFAPSDQSVSPKIWRGSEV